MRHAVYRSTAENLLAFSHSVHNALSAGLGGLKHIIYNRMVTYPPKLPIELRKKESGLVQQGRTGTEQCKGFVKWVHLNFPPNDNLQHC